ncbi:EAL domain-containing protein [Paenibacillus typhae]|uniref:PAS domain S-box-containing protein/diguanylate cyclase (GGDEF) domain-containing protein n=1 Tax=Paenibacillus typhae TaxID=1174501 RepID=A0A1G8KGC8_9BACL|nr:EAL domain-containing protein [Paenibacillus typhae]SDI42479.1 PAS domain S-box-containing protein/diguanylate cyclase (GGDEF) domain-containing protein [Paenibacillus typhae]
MKRCKCLLLISILLMLAPPAAARAERQDIKYQAELDYPPFKYIQNGYLTGFDIDLTSMVFEKQEYLIRYSTGDWEQTYQLLTSGQIDTTGLMAVTEQRKKEILFSTPVFKSYVSVYSRQALKDKVTLGTLGNYKIGVGHSQYSAALLQSKAGISKYIEYPTVPDALEALVKGEIDLLFENQGVVDYLIVEQGLTGNVIRKISNLYPVDVAYGISTSSPELVPYINARLERLQRSGAFEELYQQYFFTHSAGYTAMINDRIIFGIVIGLCLLLFGIVSIRMYIRRLRRTIHSEQEFFEDVIEHTGMIVWAVSGDGRVTRFNQFAEKMTGLKEHEVLGKKLSELPELDGDVSLLRDLLTRAVCQDFVNNVELKLPEHSPEARFFSIRTTLIKGMDDHDEAVYLLVGLDIDDCKQNELKLQLSYEELESTYEELTATETELQEQLYRLSVSERRLRLTSEGSGAYMWELDWKTGFYKLSERWYEVMGYTEDEINGMENGVLSIIHPDDQASADKARQAHLSGKTPIYETEYRMRTKDNHYIWFEVRGKAIVDPVDQLKLFNGSLIDISRRKQAEFKLNNSYQELEATYEQLTATQQELVEQYDMLLENQKNMHRLAYMDSLSNLPNRISLLEAMENYFRRPGGKAALMFVDTDNFKYINDTLGHKSGDILIRKASERLQSLVQGKGMLSRLGGDEFVVFIEDAEDRNAVLTLADDIMRAFRRSILIGESNLYVSVSIGISFYPEDGETTEEILKNADVAMYRAKEEGKGTYVIYDKSMHTAFNERMHIEKHLRSAMNNNEFELHYQPQADIRTGEITGFEALIRWNSPVLGFVSPLSFIKVAEDSRLIIYIGEWVLREACSFMKSIHERTGRLYKISVNISIIQLLQDDFVEIVLDSLKQSGLAPSCLELEITESIFMESFESTVSKLEFLKSRGIRIALDDFGTGYSSLSYLQQLPISTLKMDKIFIDSLADQAYSESFVQTIIVLGHKMGLDVVAEGVEDDSQLAFLNESGCDKVQGYLISRPVPQRGVWELLEH